MLLGLLLLAVVGCNNKPGPEKNEPAALENEQEAVKAVEKLGGKVTVDAKRPGKPVVGVYLGNTKVGSAPVGALATPRRRGTA